MSSLCNKNNTQTMSARTSSVLSPHSKQRSVKTLLKIRKLPYALSRANEKFFCDTYEYYSMGQHVDPKVHQKETYNPVTIVTRPIYNELRKTPEFKNLMNVYEPVKGIDYNQWSDFQKKRVVQRLPAVWKQLEELVRLQQRYNEKPKKATPVSKKLPVKPWQQPRISQTSQIEMHYIDKSGQDVSQVISSPKIVRKSRPKPNFDKPRFQIKPHNSWDEPRPKYSKKPVRKTMSLSKRKRSQATQVVQLVGSNSEKKVFLNPQSSELKSAIGSRSKRDSFPQMSLHFLLPTGNE